MVTNLNYVKWIQENKITLFCEDESNKDFLKAIGAKRKLFDRKIWKISCKNENDLVKILQALRDNNFMFAGGSAGWNPIDIFIAMREKNLVTGKVAEIVWRAKDQTITWVL